MHNVYHELQKTTLKSQPKQTETHQQNQNPHPAFCEIVCSPKSAGKAPIVPEDSRTISQQLTNTETHKGWTK